MTLATQLALASEQVTTDVILVNLFPYLAIRYQADDVPTTVVNGTKTLVGPCDEAAAVATILSTFPKAQVHPTTPVVKDAKTTT